MDGDVEAQDTLDSILQFLCVGIDVDGVHATAALKQEYLTILKRE